MDRVRADAIRKKYHFRWEILDVIIGGRSAIDFTAGFHITKFEDADRFIRSYGYDLDNPIERAEIFGFFHEALNFIRRHFLQPDNPDGLKLEVPRKIIELTDIRELFMMASLKLYNPVNESQGILLRNWACATLKVMHTIAHLDQDIRSTYFADIQTQIFDRYYKVIHRDAEGQLYLGERDEDAYRVDLVAFDTKPSKSRNSMLIKLLHKPGNVSEDIFDRVGIRFVTRSRLDALRVVKYLKDNMIVIPPNIKPSRSKNTLVDVDDFRAQLSELLSRAERGDLDEEGLMARLEAAAHAPLLSQDNPHSSEYYRAIQFTCRQLIKLKNPLFIELKELKALAKVRQSEDAIVKAVERINLKYLQKEVRFFYPYEVQVVDERSFEENEKGRSAHSEYKKAQLQTALRRVMGILADGIR
ncbi:MAG: hypothetical protein A3K03_02990 [Bdellovibrionales bacterium RIFOXYD1_FULL_44_7]|nr:MAG: hypothetical protein A3K03_02990 [Bdellovibrionales bacterium RIFOXYD1_FULL_44_7]